MLQQTLAVFLVLLLLGGTLWLLRKKGIARLKVSLPRRPGGVKRLEVLDRIVLTPHHSLHLVRLDNRTVLIGVSPSGCTQIDPGIAPGTPLRREECLA
jgi:flagellar biogenesis protein FliO